MVIRLVTGMQPTSCCCCCPLEVVPLGVLPAMLMLRRDPALTPGQGFAVSFIANGIGSIVLAVSDLVRFDGQARDALIADFRQQLERLNERAEQKLTAEQMDDLVNAMAAIQPYVPVVFAAVFTVLAGMCGLFAVDFLRRRRALPRPPIPPTPPVSPPPAAPV